MDAHDVNEMTSTQDVTAVRSSTLQRNAGIVCVGLVGATLYLC